MFTLPVTRETETLKISKSVLPEAFRACSPANPMREHLITATPGSTAPDFCLQDTNGNQWRLSDKLGCVVLLLFYPANETLMCTKQLCSVRDNWAKYLETKKKKLGHLM